MPDFFSQCQEGFNNASFVKSGIENANLATLAAATFVFVCFLLCTGLPTLVIIILAFLSRILFLSMVWPGIFFKLATLEEEKKN